MNLVLVFGDILMTRFSNILEKRWKKIGFFMHPINFNGENNFLKLEFFQNQYGDPYFLFEKSMWCMIDIVHTKFEQILMTMIFSH